MERANQHTAEQIERVLAPATLAFILIAAGVAFALGFVIDSGMSNPELLYGVLVLVAIADLVIIRWFVLPAQAKAGAPRQNQATTGYAVAATGATFAVAASIFSGDPWPALPLGAIAVISWLVIRSYLRDLPEGPPVLDMSRGDYSG